MADYWINGKKSDYAAVWYGRFFIKQLIQCLFTFLEDVYIIFGQAFKVKEI